VLIGFAKIDPVRIGVRDTISFRVSGESSRAIDARAKVFTGFEEIGDVLGVVVKDFDIVQATTHFGTFLVTVLAAFNGCHLEQIIFERVDEFLRDIVG
jgi:hypothetical protein